MNEIMRRLGKESWSPYAAGVLLGVTCILAVALANHLLGASGAIASLSGSLLQWVAPASVQNNIYYRFTIPTGLTWEGVLLIGVFFGGMLGALSSHTWRLRWNDDPLWRKVIGPQPWKRLVIGFVGAVILQYGAGIAGGCTSGLAISGGMLLAPAAFLFMVGMFASGIVTALIVYGRRY
ncbi:MAG: YeeE/YedE family protein [Chloroflexi bacterium]|nr:YeeE/YedE family protein [Chloroflexota bacterium]